MTLVIAVSISSDVLATVLDTDSITCFTLPNTPTLKLGTKSILGSSKFAKASSILVFNFVFNVWKELLILAIALLIRLDVLTKGEAIAIKPFFSFSSRFISGNLKLAIAAFTLVIESVDRALNDSFILPIDVVIDNEACSVAKAKAFTLAPNDSNILRSMLGTSWISGICIFSKLFFILLINASILSSTYLNPSSIPAPKPCIKNWPTWWAHFEGDAIPKDLLIVFFIGLTIPKAILLRS